MKHPFRPFLACLPAIVLLLLTWPVAGQSWQRVEAPGKGTATLSAADAHGNLFVVGSFSDTLSLGALPPIGSSAYETRFIAKQTPTGPYSWVVTLPAAIEIYGLTTDTQGDVYLTGGYRAPAVFGATTLPFTGVLRLFVAKLTAAGTWAWAQTSDTYMASEIAKCVAVDASGNVFVGGYFFNPTLVIGSTTLTNPGSRWSTVNAFVAKLSPAGTWQWVTGITGDGNELLNAMVVDPAGNVVVAGPGYGAPTFGPITLPTFDGLFVARLRPTGTWAWATTTDRYASYGSHTSLCVTPGGETYLADSFAGSVTLGATTLTTVGNHDVLVAKLDTTGQWQWAVRAGGIDDEFNTALALTPAGDLVVGGNYVSPTVAFGATTPLVNLSIRDTVVNIPPTPARADNYVAGLSAAGQWQWARSLGGRGYELLESMAISPQGEISVAGSFSSDTLTVGSLRGFNPDTTTSQVYIARLGTPTGLTSAVAPAAPFTLAPNPAHHTVQLTNAPAAEAEIVDALGLRVRVANLERRTANLLDLTSLPPGLYVVRCGEQTRRLVVE